MQLNEVMTLTNAQIITLLTETDEDIELPDKKLIRSDELNYLLENDEADVAAQTINIRRLITIYRMVQQPRVRGRLRRILNQLAI